MQPKHHITQHIRYVLTPLSFGTLLPSVAMSYMLKTLSKMSLRFILLNGTRAYALS